MQDTKIIFKKGKHSSDYFALIIMLITILLVAFQIMASKQISKANNAFFEGEKAKKAERIALIEKSQREQFEKELIEERLQKQKEEEAYLASLEEQNRPEEKNKFAEVANGMDYRQKLDVYRKSNQAK